MSATFARNTMFGIPHRTPPKDQARDMESQPTPKTQVLPGSALRADPERHDS
jgi:hypothetical protein